MRCLFRWLVLVLMGLAVLKVSADGKDDDASAAPMPVKIEGNQAAPEFKDITAWIHTKPLTMKGLKDKVVVVHFMTFG
jgi:hypothetical protein